MQIINADKLRRRLGAKRNDTMDGRFRWLRLEPADCWPGLSRLWHGGQVRGLTVAIVFSILLNATLVAALIWPAIWSRSIKLGLVGATGVVWAGGWVDARRIRRLRDLSRRRDPQLDLFLAARGEYLKSNWSGAEEHLAQLLSATPEDVEARLMLATLLRHQERLAEAKEQLRRLQRWSRAAIWNLEIRQEWERLSKLECSAEPMAQSDGPSDPPASRPGQSASSAAA